MRHVYYGVQYSDNEICNALERSGTTFHALSPDQLVGTHGGSKSPAARWWAGSRGACEFGPRALGNRSILADPRRADMKDILNSRIKLS